MQREFERSIHYLLIIYELNGLTDRPVVVAVGRVDYEWIDGLLIVISISCENAPFAKERHFRIAIVFGPRMSDFWANITTATYYI